MNCEQVTYELIELLEGTSSTDQAQLLRDHLHDCKSCQAFYDELQSSFNIINEEKVIAISDDFTSSVMTSIAKKNEVVSVNFRVRIKRVLQYAAVIAFGIFIGTLTGNILIKESPQVSENNNQEFYLDGLKSEPIESFLISN